MNNLRIISSLMTIFVLSGLMLFAQQSNIPWEISYQGILTDTTGAATEDGYYNLEVGIFNQITGGTELFNESHTNVEVKNGFFNIIIGDQTPDGLYPELNTEGNLFLELRVNGGDPILPRFKIRPSPVAILALTTGLNSVDSNSITDNTVSLKDINSSRADAGDVLVSDGTNLTWGTPSGLSMPASFEYRSGSTYHSFALGDFYAPFRVDTSSRHGVMIDFPKECGVWVERAYRDGINVAGLEDGIYAWGDFDNNGSGYAGIFNGNVNIIGNLSKGSGSFKIDHPLYPESKYLYHSFVESPDMMNVYNGNVQLNQNGEAVVELPEYFEALNKDFRYQLTAIGVPGPNLYVAAKISGNQFKIAGGKPGMEVSWQVTGVRNDPYAKANRIKVEVNKDQEDIGYYLYPELYGIDIKEGVGVKDRFKEMQRHKEEKRMNKLR